MKSAITVIYNSYDSYQNLLLFHDFISKAYSTLGTGIHCKLTLKSQPGLFQMRKHIIEFIIDIL